MATVHIHTNVPPGLVVYREGTRGRWRPARQLTATTFEARVHGPYVVSVVCVDDPVLGVESELLTWQLARTPEDSRDLSFCDEPLAAPHSVTGHMVQAGSVQLGDSFARSRVADWDFALPVASGSFDLVATSADAIAVRRGLAVAGDLAVSPPVDLAQEGTGLVEVAFSAPNATADETTQVSVGLLNPTLPFLPARIYLGPLAGAKVAPDAALIATDTQSASVRAFAGAGFRALRRPFRVGGDPAYILPPSLEGVQWSIAGGEVTAHWAGLPDFTLFAVNVGGNAAGGATPVNYLANLSPRFLAATGIHDFTIETDMPGFRPEWTIDFTSFYNRDLTVQNVPTPDVVLTSEVTELIDPAPAAQLAPPARPSVDAPASPGSASAPVRRGHGALEP